MIIIIRYLDPWENQGVMKHLTLLLWSQGRVETKCPKPKALRLGPKSV